MVLTLQEWLHDLIHEWLQIKGPKVDFTNCIALLEILWSSNKIWFGAFGGPILKSSPSIVVFLIFVQIKTHCNLNLAIQWS